MWSQVLEPGGRDAGVLAPEQLSGDDSREDLAELDGKLGAWLRSQKSTRYVRAPLEVVFPGDGGVPWGGFDVAWGNPDPRLGFAWDVFGDGKTAVRGGSGIFFDMPNTIAMSNQSNQAPFGKQVAINGALNNSFADPWAGTANAFPGTPAPPSTVAFPQSANQEVAGAGFRNGCAQSWNLLGVDNARARTGNQRAGLTGDPYFTEDRTRGQQIAEWLRRPAFRFEAFNALNRVSLQGPNPAQNNASFMRTAGAEDPRILRSTLRLTL